MNGCTQLLLLTLYHLPLITRSITLIDVDKVWNDDFAFKDDMDPFNVSGWIGDKRHVDNTQHTKMGHGIYLENTYSLSRYFMCSKWSEILINYTMTVCMDNDHAIITLYLNDTLIQQTKSDNNGFITSSDNFGTHCNPWSEKDINVGYGENKFITYTNTIFEVKFKLQSEHDNDPIVLSNISIQCRSIPSSNPTQQPTSDPTINPTKEPTKHPTNQPTSDPAIHPTINPTSNPTQQPTSDPMINPTNRPTFDSTINPTDGPTDGPTSRSTHNPTSRPSKSPDNNPRLVLTYDTNTKYPTNSPTKHTIHTTTTNGNIQRVQKLENMRSTYFILMYVGIVILMCCCIPFCIISYQKWKKGANSMIRIGDKTPNSATSATSGYPNVSVVQMRKMRMFTDSIDRNDNINVIHNNMNDMDIENIRNFINYKIELPQYLDIFIKNGYNDLNMIQQIQNIEELKNIGIDNKQHQHRIMGEIHILKSKMPSVTPITPGNDNIAMDEFIIDDDENNEEIVDGEHATTGRSNDNDSIDHEQCADNQDIEGNTNINLTTNSLKIRI